MRWLPSLLLVGFAAVAAGVAVGGDDRGEPPSRPDGPPATCAYQSSFQFDRSRRDLVVGPFVLVGGRTHTSREVVARFGGQKYPAVVLAGHRVVVELPRGMRRTSLLYADETRERPDGERTVRDGHRVVEFRACRAGRGLSSYDGREATFWSGFVMTTLPRCLRLRVWVDEEPRARRAHVALGRRCR